MKAADVTGYRSSDLAATTVRPRITLLVTGLASGGAEKQFVALSRHLTACGWDTEVISLLPATRQSPITQQFVGELEESGIPLWSLGFQKGPAVAPGLAALFRRLRRRRPQILCTFMFHANVCGKLVGRLAGVPVIVSSIRNERFGARWKDHAEACTERLCDVTVVNSESVAASLHARGVLHRDRCRVIPNAIDFSPFVGRPSSVRAATRRDLGLSDDVFTWLVVSRLDPHKDHASLLRAVARLRRHAPPLRLLVAGDGVLRDPLRGLCRELSLDDTVSWLGFRDDVPNLIAASDASVLASRWEGSPNVVLEALAGGLPVVATDVGGNRDLVVEGTSGFLLPPGDDAALAAAMERVMRLSPEIRTRMGAEGHRFVLRRHDAGTVLEQWRSLLLEAHAAKASPRAVSPSPRGA
jgi:glycosyltransferase involved in cell wall biosynthesis